MTKVDPPSSVPAAAKTIAAAELAGILRSVGEVAYTWDLASDALAWGDNAANVLMTPAAIATGRAYAGRVVPTDGVSRFDAIMRAVGRDDGNGVPYQTQYCLSAGMPNAGKLWVEDVGRWFAGPDGRPACAHGVVRVINERHAREERLAYLSQFDGLTGEINRVQLLETLQIAFDETTRLRSSCGFFLLAIDHLGRINEAYGFAVADEVIDLMIPVLFYQIRKRRWSKLHAPEVKHENMKHEEVDAAVGQLSVSHA